MQPEEGQGHGYGGYGGEFTRGCLGGSFDWSARPGPLSVQATASGLSKFMAIWHM